MKTAQQIEIDLNARKAELTELAQAHQKMCEQFQMQRNLNQQRVNYLEGVIATLEGLLPKKKKDA